VATIFVAAAWSAGAAGGRSAAPPACATGGLRLGISDQGTSGNAFIGIRAKARSRCTIAGSARLTIMQGRSLARIDGNPISLRVGGVLSPSKSQLVAHAWWIGWCRSRKALSLRVRYRTLSVRAVPRYVPRCDSQTERSRLVAAR
jgi:hypothetical protein